MLWKYAFGWKEVETKKNMSISTRSKVKAAEAARPVRRPLISRPLDALFFVYFIIHIPIALLFDAQSVLPQQWYPRFAVDAVKAYVEKSGDFLVGTNPDWFCSIIFVEITCQFIFFFYGAYATYMDSRTWRIPGVICEILLFCIINV
jgi:hypothetical protein